MTIHVRIKSTVILLGLITLLVVGCGGMQDLSNLTSTQLYELGVKQFEKNDYRKSIQTFQALVYNNPGASIVDTAQYYLALSYFNNEDYELAAVEFNRLVLNYPSSPFFEAAMFHRAVSEFEATPENHGLDQSELPDAIKKLEDFIIDYPESAYLAQAQHYLEQARNRLAHKAYTAAKTYHHMGAYEAAITYYQIVLDEYTNSPWAADAAYHQGEMYSKRRMYDSAHVKFEQFISVFPTHEKVDDARKKLIETAFKDAEQAYEQGELAEAVEKFNAFIADYPDSDKTASARSYLEKIGPLPQSEAMAKDGDS